MHSKNIPGLYDFHDVPRNIATTSSTVVFLAAWLIGTTGLLLSTLSVVLQWVLPQMPTEPVSFPSRRPIPHTRPSVGVHLPHPKSVLISNDPSAPQSRSNFNRHVSFSLGSNAKQSIIISQQRTIMSLPNIESHSSPSASPVHSAESATLVASPSPRSCSVDLPPLEDMPPPPFESNVQIESIPSRCSPVPSGASSLNPFKSRKQSSSTSSPKFTTSSQPDNASLSSSSSDRPINLPRISELGEQRRISFMDRFSMKGRRSSNASRMPQSTSSAPTTPHVSTMPFTAPKRSSHRATASVSAIDISSPAFSNPVSGQSRRSLSTFIGLNIGSRTSPTPSPQPLRTQPYGPPYNCPLPQPTSGSATHRKTSSMSNVVPSQ